MPTRGFLKSSSLSLLLFFSGSAIFGRQDAPTNSRQKLLLTVEALGQNGWKTVNAQSVFKQQDRLRFRFHTSLGGYLYILDSSSSGRLTWIYPVAGEPASNHLAAGESLTIPGQPGVFVIGGAPGFDTLYWILRTAPFEIPQAPDQPMKTPSTLVSTCPAESPGDKSKGELACIDKNAGPKPVPDPAKLSAAIGLKSSLVARDLTFQAKPEGTEIAASSDAEPGDIVYQLRIAHQ